MFSSPLVPFQTYNVAVVSASPAGFVVRPSNYVAVHQASRLRLGSVLFSDLSGAVLKSVSACMQYYAVRSCSGQGEDTSTSRHLGF